MNCKIILFLPFLQAKLKSCKFVVPNIIFNENYQFYRKFYNRSDK